MHHDYPQGGCFTVPGSDFSVIIAFVVEGRGIGNGKWLDP